MQYEVREEYINDFKNELVLEAKFIENDIEFIKILIKNYINYFNNNDIELSTFNTIMNTVNAAKITNLSNNSLIINDSLIIDYQKFYFLYSLGGVDSLKNKEICDKCFYPKETNGLLNYSLLGEELEKEIIENLEKIKKYEKIKEIKDKDKLKEKLYSIFDSMFYELNTEILKYYFGVVMKTCYIENGDSINFIQSKLNSLYTINTINSIFKYMNTIPFKYSLSIDTEKEMISTNDLFKLNKHFSYLPKIDNKDFFSINSLSFNNILLNKNLYKSQSNESICNYFKSKKELNENDIKALLQRDIFNLKEFVDFETNILLDNEIDLKKIDFLLKKINYKQATYPIGKDFKSFSFFYNPLLCNLITKEIHKINNIYYLLNLCFNEDKHGNNIFCLNKKENKLIKKAFFQQLKKEPISKKTLEKILSEDKVKKIFDHSFFKSEIKNNFTEFTIQYKKYLIPVYRTISKKKYFKKSIKATPFLSNPGNIDSSIKADNYVINNEIPSFGFETFNEKVFYNFEKKFEKDQIEAIFYLMINMFLNKKLLELIIKKIDFIINYKIINKYIRSEIKSLNRIISKHIIKTIIYLKDIGYLDENENFEDLVNKNKESYLKYLFLNLTNSDLKNFNKDNLFLEKINLDFKLIFKKEALKYV